ncbi:hypothetical protein D3C71_1611250 [compost metagenome]
MRTKQGPVELFRHLAHLGRDVAAFEERLVLVQADAAVQAVHGAVQSGVGKQQFEGTLRARGGVIGQHHLAALPGDRADLF